MGISYAPFGEDDEVPSSLVIPPQKTAATVRSRAVVRTDMTECNYLVLFFVLGVFLLNIV